MTTLHDGTLYITDVDGIYRKATVDDTDCSSGILSAMSLIDDKINTSSIRTGTMVYTGRGSMMSPNMKMLPEISRVIFNDPATVVMWSDGTKTVVKTRQKGRKKDKFSKEYGLAMAIAKKYCGNRSRFVKLVESGKKIAND